MKAKELVSGTRLEQPLRRLSYGIRSAITYQKLKYNLQGTPDILFVWIPKTAGTMLFLELNRTLRLQKLKKVKHFRNFPNKGAVTFGHVHYLSLLNSGLVSAAYNKKAFKFSVVRSPYERVISLYNYLLGLGLLKEEGIDQFLDTIMYYRPPIGLYNVVGLSQTNPQVDWILDEAGGLIVDRVFRMEDLNELHEFFLRTHGVDLNVIERQNISKKKISSDDIFAKNDRLAKINEIYKRDFRLLSYEMRT